MHSRSHLFAAWLRTIFRLEVMGTQKIDKYLFRIGYSVRGVPDDGRALSNCFNCCLLQQNVLGHVSALATVDQGCRRNRKLSNVALARVLPFRPLAFRSCIWIVATHHRRHRCGHLKSFIYTSVRAAGYRSHKVLNCARHVGSKLVAHGGVGTSSSNM